MRDIIHRHQMLASIIIDERKVKEPHMYSIESLPLSFGKGEDLVDVLWEFSQDAETRGLAKDSAIRVCPPVHPRWISTQMVSQCHSVLIPLSIQTCNLFQCLLISPCDQERK